MTEAPLILIPFRCASTRDQLLSFFQRWHPHARLLPCQLSGNGEHAAASTSAAPALRAAIAGLEKPCTVWIVDALAVGDWASFASLISALDDDPSIPGLCSYSDDPDSILAAPSISRLGPDLVADLMQLPLSAQPGIPIAARGGNVCFLREDPRTAHLFASPGLAPEILGIRWPVSDEEERRAVLARLLDLGIKAGHPAARYRGTARGRWFHTDLERWTHWFADAGVAKRALCIGDVDGIAACVLLTELFTHPASAAWIVRDPPAEGDPVDANLGTARITSRCTVISGCTIRLLAGLIHCAETSPGNFDFITLEGCSSGDTMMTTLALAWCLLRPAGLIAVNCSTGRVGEVHDFEALAKSMAALPGARLRIKHSSDYLILGKLAS